MKAAGNIHSVPRMALGESVSQERDNGLLPCFYGHFDKKRQYGGVDGKHVSPKDDRVWRIPGIFACAVYLFTRLSIWHLVCIFKFMVFEGHNFSGFLLSSWIFV
jgi:hypothetical protein